MHFQCVKELRYPIPSCFVNFDKFMQIMHGTYLLRFAFNTLILGYKIHRLPVSVMSTIFRLF
jgi:hypothetical protein